MQIDSGGAQTILSLCDGNRHRMIQFCRRRFVTGNVPMLMDTRVIDLQLGKLTWIHTLMESNRPRYWLRPDPNQPMIGVDGALRLTESLVMSQGKYVNGLENRRYGSYADTTRQLNYTPDQLQRRVVWLLQNIAMTVSYPDK